MKKLIPFFIALLLIPATAYGLDVTNSTYDTITAATAKVMGNLQAMSIKLFYVLTLLQLTIMLIGQLSSGDIESSLSRLAKGILWMMFCLYLMTNNHAYNFVANTLQYFLNNAIGWASGTAANFDAGGIIATGMVAMDNTRKAIFSASLNSTIAFFMPGGLTATVIYGALVFVLTVIIILITSGYVALKVFMVKIETALLLAVMPLSLALLGMNALREQGMAPFKTMLALIYRIVILGIVVGGMAAVSAALAAYAASAADPNILEISLSLAFGFVLLAFIAHKSDQIASSLASGSASLGSSDAMSTAAAAGAAAGVTAAMGAMVGNGAASTVKSMGDFLKSLGSSGSINNASSRGNGGSKSEASPAPTRAMASMMTGTSPSSSGNATPGNAAPQRGNTGSDAAASTSKSGTSSNGKDGGTAQSTTSNSAAPASSSSAPATQASGDNGSAAGTEVAGQTPDSAAPPPMAPSRSGASVDVSDAPQRSSGADGAGKSPESAAPPPVTPSGSGANAGIEGAPQRPASLEASMQKIADALGGAPKKPTAKENLAKHAGNLSQHVQGEKRDTHVSVNTHHSE